MSVLIVSGTGTGVGKTVVTAALGACAKGAVAVVKPAQTGRAPGAPGDVADVSRLAGLDAVHEFARYPDPLLPHQAAEASGRPALEFAATVRRITDLDALHDQVLVDGVGGVLVPFTGTDRWTLCDLGATLRAPVLVVTTTGLDALNASALTVGRLAEDGVELAGIVIGSWPDEPDAATRAGVADLAAMAPDGRLAGALPAGMAAMRDFRRRARATLAPRFGGTFDAVAFAAVAAVRQPR